MPTYDTSGAEQNPQGLDDDALLDGPEWRGVVLEAPLLQVTFEQVDQSLPAATAAVNLPVTKPPIAEDDDPQ
jgi:hypothetical protein